MRDRRRIEVFQDAREWEENHDCLILISPNPARVKVMPHRGLPLSAVLFWWWSWSLVMFAFISFLAGPLWSKFLTTIYPYVYLLMWCISPLNIVNTCSLFRKALYAGIAGFVYISTRLRSSIWQWEDAPIQRTDSENLEVVSVESRSPAKARKSLDELHMPSQSTSPVDKESSGASTADPPHTSF
jgi:hypothetical protein